MSQSSRPPRACSISRHRSATLCPPVRRVLLSSLCAALGILVSAECDARTMIKLATLVPDGSVWDRELEEMGAEWDERSGGEVSLRIYPGGVAGDEPDVVRKMRIGQIQGAALTTVGLTALDDAFRVFEIPMFYDSYEELFHVLDVVRPELESRLEKKGFVLLAWGHGGWVHFFSKEPIGRPADLRAQKIFTWAGNERAVQLWRKNGYQPVALAATDILTGLQTGMIDAVPTTPLAALGLQWYRQTPYMQDLGLAPLVGGLVVTKASWDKVPEAQRTMIRETAARLEGTLAIEVPKQDREAIEAMRERGLEVVPASPESMAQWRALAEEFASVQEGEVAVPGLLDRVRAARDAFRSGSDGR